LSKFEKHSAKNAAKQNSNNNNNNQQPNSNKVHILWQQRQLNANKKTSVAMSSSAEASTEAAAAADGASGGAAASGWNVKFVPFSSAVDSPFWVRYCQEKLETIQLNEDAIPIRATFGVADGSAGSASAAAAAAGGNAAGNSTTRSPRLQCQESSLLLNHHDKDGSLIPNERIVVNGTLIGFNTKESFQKTDKNALIHDAFCPAFFKNNSDNDDQKVVQSLHSVLLLTFPDLKNHKVLYWFAFPALMTRSGKSIRAVQQELFAKSASFSAQDCTALCRHVAQMRLSQFLAASNDDTSSSSNNNNNNSAGLVPYFIWSKSKASCLPLSIQNYKQLVHDGQEKDNDDKEKEENNMGDNEHESVVFGFFDPVAAGGNTSILSPEAPTGWSLRNLVAYLSIHLNLGGKTVNILSYRPGRLHRLSREKCNNAAVDMEQQIAWAQAQDDSQSILLRIVVPTKHDYKWDEICLTTSGQKTKYRVVGWELNARAKSGPRSVNLRPILDPQHLAIQAADLNLKLMKWRQIPALNVEKLQSCKALILGAGTLGCNVARILLGWGVRHFKIIDNGKVSYSNPVRQPLFTLEDCHSEKDGSGSFKAVAAAEALKTIAADVESEGLVLSIPMPGHAGESHQVIAEAVEALDKLVQECDVVFLLTDTRESRWLPTIMAAAYDKMLINAALGLDSWLVMRHGGGGVATDSSSSSFNSCRDPPDTATARLLSQRLGCYFCNDIVAPENSTKNRTLDQQCTVTRPGLAPIASSMAVEMMVALLHHDDGTRAPAPAAAMSNYSPTVSAADGASSSSSISPLGVIPHQVRGSLVSYTMMKPTVPAFKSCTGCSGGVVQAYLQDKVGVVFSVCQSVEYLENISGLTSFRAEAAEKMDNLDAWDDDEDDGGEIE
jgi:ubiquitin-like modifier-activating enzyme ATG7